jgi:N-acetylmuramoyl-L-alanine amidase
MTRRSETKHIVVHCSATKPSMDIGRREIREWHIARGWVDIGYHAVIRRNGLIEFGRAFDEIGAHVASHNSTTVGVCLVGGLTEGGAAPLEGFADLFTDEQEHALVDLLQVLLAAYPDAEIVGHRDLSPDANHNGKIDKWEFLKSCPGFTVAEFCKRHGLQ